MKTIIILIIIILLILFCIPSKEKFYGNLLYPGVHAYHQDSYNYGLHGTKRRNHLNLGKFSDYIPVINHIIL